MSYLVFARKWRPQNFDQVIGQEHIATTLKNAIERDRVAHAYLFSGPRGVGKTSTARILAKALNCQKGPVAEPCNVCSSCREISEGRSLDVIEIDGASNRGIEQIRQLRENVKFAPANSRFKIYIIDEVHQITSDGFNALLKTLEEPPAHVKFIFATTQAHKVLPTILSRCQRFDFKPLANADIIRKLKQIIKKEKLEITDQALSYIAQAVTGSMRDAESILDQLSSFSRDKLNLEDVTLVLGTVDLEVIRQLAQKIIERNSTQALKLLEKIINQGKDLAQLVSGLMEHFRHILVLKVVGRSHTDNLVDLPEEELTRLKQQGQKLSLEEIFYIFNLLTRTQESLRRALSARVIVEMAVIRLTQRDQLLSLKEILSKLTQLEQNLGQNSQNQVEQEPVEQNQVEQDPMAQNQTALPDQPVVPADQPAAPDPPALDKPDADLNHNWSNLVQAIKEKKMFLASSLELGQMLGVSDKVLTVAFPEKYNFCKETLEQPENKTLVKTKAKEIFQRDLEIEFVLDKSLEQNSSPEQASSENTVTDSVVQSALKMFQGRIIKRRSLGQR